MNRRRKRLDAAVTSSASAPPVEDLKQLKHWIADQSGPLLLLAEFGLGKSVLLAYFACRLAEDLFCWCEDSESRPLPPVPLPVRLRNWKWHKEQIFSDYICGFSQSAL